MAKTKNLLYRKSKTVVDKNGIFIIDIMTSPYRNFVYRDRAVEYTLREEDVYRWDLLMLARYNQVDYYGEVVLALNSIQHLDDDQIGQIVLLPSKRDLDNFLLANLE